MNTPTGWIALLDEDEEDFIFWQHGFRCWANHLELRWFASPHAFLAAAGLGKSNPVALMLDGVVPTGEETKWLSTLLVHPSLQQASLIMLSGQEEEHKHEAYLRLGATDHLIKPVNLTELQTLVQTVSHHIANRHL